MATINGTAAGETINGTGDADTINGLGGNDTINAGGGNDTIDGGDGADTVHGQDGNDIIKIGAGDSITGDAGNDSFSFVSGGVAAIASTYVDGGADTDSLTVDFSAAVDAISTNTNGNGNGYIAGIYYYAMEHVTIYGGSASDSLYGNLGDDRLDGNAGNDRLYGGLGANLLNGGAGSDYGEIDLRASNAAVSFSFTGDANFSLGGNMLTGIEGLGVYMGDGNDTASVANATLGSLLDGGGGADTLTGSSIYADTLNGGSGNDIITAAFGDNVNAGLDDDRITVALGSQAATTYADGGGGNDRLVLTWTAATDAITSSNNGNGNGSISANGSTLYYYGIETLQIAGGTASDQLSGGLGSDTISGNAGNDVITGGRGNDKLDGGAGKDRGIVDNSDSATGRSFTFVSGQTLSVGGDTLTGFEGIGYTGGGGADTMDVVAETIGSILYGGNGNDTFRTDNAIADQVDGGSGNDTFTLGAGDNVNGRDGDDRFNFASDAPGFAATYVDGDIGDDLLTVDFSASADGVGSSNNGNGNGSIGNALYYYNIERLDITGSSASDTLIGGVGADTISGGAGNDSVDGGRGANTLDGGAGVDLGSVDMSDDATARTITFVSGQTLTVGGNTLANFEGLGFRAGNGADKISVAGEKRGSTIYGGGGNDTLTSGAKYADYLDGQDGNDIITGGLGDVVHGGGDDDTLHFAFTQPGFASTYAYGDAGVDKLYVTFAGTADSVTSGANVSSGSIGSLYYYDIESVDFTGGNASDTLVAGAGNDTLRGGTGDDRLDGGKGTNTIVGGTGLDIGLVDQSDDATARTVALSATGSVSGAGSSLTQIEGLGYRGGSGADVINVANGTRGSEIYGGGGNDTITGSAAVADTLDGGDANDIITGGSGDNVNGRAGDDSLRFTGSSAFATTYAYGDEGTDLLTLNFSGATVGNDLSGNSNGTSNGYFAGIYFYDIERLVATGGAGNDTIAGVAGNDTLNGGGGNDVLIGYGGADTLNGGTAGNDIFRYYNLADSTVAAAGRDTIGDFAAGDTIDLSALDANSGVSGDQAFSFIGTAAFTGAGQLRYETVGGNRLVSGDVNGDGAADFAIMLTGTGTLTGTSFNL